MHPHIPVAIHQMRRALAISIASFGDEAVQYVYIFPPWKNVRPAAFPEAF